MTQTNLDQFSDVYDPTEEMGGTLLDRNALIDRLKEKYRWSSEAGAGENELKQTKNLAEMDVFGDAIDAFIDGAEKQQVYRMMQERHQEAKEKLENPESEREEADLRGREGATWEVLDLLS